MQSYLCPFSQATHKVHEGGHHTILGLATHTPLSVTKSSFHVLRLEEAYFCLAGWYSCCVDHKVYNSQKWQKYVQCVTNSIVHSSSQLILEIKEHVGNIYSRHWNSHDLLYKTYSFYPKSYINPYLLLLNCFYFRICYVVVFYSLYP